MYSENQLKIAIAKLKTPEEATLHVDTTGNIVKKINGCEVFLTSCIFRGMYFRDIIVYF